MTSDGPRLLWLITGDGTRLSIPDSDALAVLLSELSGDLELQQTLKTCGIDPGALAPTDSAAEEPEWLRAEAMLEEAAVCPGERLFAGTLTAAAHRHRAAEIAIAARALAAAVVQGAIPSPHPRRVEAACLALAAVASQLPASLQIELADVSLSRGLR